MDLRLGAQHVLLWQRKRENAICVVRRSNHEPIEQVPYYLLIILLLLLPLPDCYFYKISWFVGLPPGGEVGSGTGTHKLLDRLLQPLIVQVVRGPLVHAIVFQLEAELDHDDGLFPSTQPASRMCAPTRNSTKTQQPRNPNTTTAAKTNP